MAATESTHRPRRLRRTLLMLALTTLVIWLTFFDSHSLLRRVRWHHEQAHLAQENARLQEQIKDLEARLDETTSDEVVERIAREQYGMRRPGETVYRVE